MHPYVTWGKEVATSEWTRLSWAGEKQTRVKRQSLTVLVNEVRVWQHLELVMEGFEVEVPTKYVGLDFLVSSFCGGVLAFCSEESRWEPHIHIAHIFLVSSQQCRDSYTRKPSRLYGRKTWSGDCSNISLIENGGRSPGLSTMRCYPESWTWWYTPLVLALRGQLQADLCVFKASLAYVVHSRPPRPT